MTAQRRFPDLSSAMREQVQRVNGALSAEDYQRELKRITDLLADAQEKIEQLTTERDNLLDQLSFERRQRPQTGLTVNGRAVVSQAAAAKSLSVSPYQISRWVAAGHFETTHVEGRAHALIYADSLHTPSRKRK